MTVQDIKNRMAPVNAGYWCPPEWEDLVVRLDEEIAKVDPDYKVLQVKSKFGGLRYYYRTSEGLSKGKQNIIRDLVYFAEREARGIDVAV